MLACRLHELAKVLSKHLRQRAQRTRGARYAHGRRSRTGVGKGQCQRQRFHAAAVCDSNVDEMLRHAIFDACQMLFVADVFVCTFTSRDGAHTGIISFGNWIFPAFWEEVFFRFTVSFFGSICWRHTPGQLTKDSRMDLNINRLWSTANQSKL